MDLGRFHRATEQLADAYKAANFPSLLDQLVSDLNTLASNPSDQGTADAYRARLELIRQTLYSHDQEVRTGAAAEIIDALELDDVVGKGLFDKVKQTIAEHHLSPALAGKALKALRDDVEKTYRHIVAMDDAFSALQVEYEELDGGEAEISLSLPMGRDERTLSDLSQEAKEWNQIIATLSEVFDSNRPQTKIRTLATGSWLFYLTSTPLVLWGIAVSLRRVNEILSEALRTKDLIKQLTAVKAPTKEVEEHQERQLSSGLENLAKELVETHYKGNDEGRKNELITGASIALKQLAKKIASGSRVNLRISSPKKPKVENEGAPTAEEAQQLEAVKKLEDQKLQIDAELARIEYLEDISDVAALLPAPPEEQTR